MTTLTCTRRLQFCAGHRVMGHENKCAHLHGHNYVVWLTAEASGMQAYKHCTGLDSVGRIIDFSVLKELFGNWINKHWDHGFILSSADTQWVTLLQSQIIGLPGHQERQKLFLLPDGLNPTAEGLAWFLLDEVGPALLDGLPVRLTKVTVDETENCSATACLNLTDKPRVQT